MKFNFLIVVLVLLASFHQAVAQGTAFNYQGTLYDGTNPANGSYDLMFTVFPADSGGTLSAGPLTNSATAVSNGLFTVTLDFGSGVFEGASYWLEVGVRTNGNGGFITLASRQAITPAPYAIYSASAATAVTAGSANSVAAANIIGTVPLAQLPAGVLTNNQNGVTLGGTFKGNGGGLTGLNATNLTGNLPGGLGSAGSFTVAGTLTADNANHNNGTVGPGLVLGLNSGEGIASKRTAGGNQYGLDFFTASQSRLSILNGGKIGMGKSNPATALDVNGTVTATAFAGGGGGLSNINFSQVISGTGNVDQAIPYNAFLGGGYLNLIQSNATAAVVAGGWNNIIQTNAYEATIAGGWSNAILANAWQATIAGGWSNSIAAAAYQSTIGGGYNNLAGGSQSTVGGGQNNSAIGAAQATVGGGYNNTASGSESTVGGGQDNQATGTDATVGGGLQNFAGGFEGVVAGGYANSANNEFATVCGGSGNQTYGAWSTVTGGANNIARGDDSFIGGGTNNLASGYEAVVAGGANNTASAVTAFVGGGYVDTASGPSASVGGGGFNLAGGYAATVSGGWGNQANNGSSAVGGGTNNLASGVAATVPGGFANTALGDYSVAAGHEAQALHQGAFVWADSQNAPFASTASDQFLIRAQGGLGINTNNSQGAALNVNGSITASGTVTANGVLLTSDRNAKENFAPLDSQIVLAKVAALSLTQWNYKNDATGVRHVGPMAQDFQAAFRLNGGDDKHISMVDESGVALAAIQGLNQKLEQQNRDQEAEIQALKQSLAELTRTVQSLARQPQTHAAP